MELLDIAFYLLALAYILVAARAYHGIEEDDTATHKTHFAAAALLLVGLLGILYLRLHGGLCIHLDKSADFKSLFPGMKLRSSRKQN